MIGVEKKRKKETDYGLKMVFSRGPCCVIACRETVPNGSMYFPPTSDIHRIMNKLFMKASKNKKNVQKKKIGTPLLV